MKRKNQVAKNAKNGTVELQHSTNAVPKTEANKLNNKNLVNKKKNKIEQKILAPAKEIKVESNTEDDDDDSGADLMETVTNDVLQNSDLDEEDSDANVSEDSDENNETNEENSDDEAPVEKAIEKKPKHNHQQGKNVETRDRRIYIRRLNVDTTEEQVKEHFSRCGEIESVKVSKAPRLKNDAVMVFKNPASISEALKLHNTILNDSNILVEHAESPRTKSDEQRSIILMNTDGYTKLEASVIEEIFSKFGKIESLNVVCEKNVLAYLVFEDAKAIPKAMELNGTTANGLKIAVNLYKSKPKLQKTKVFVKNIASGVTEDDLRGLFQACGNVVKVSLKNNNATLATAIVEFEDQDGYCKAFLLHEEKLRGRSLFIEPFSVPKKFGGQTKGQHFGGNKKGKRPAQQKWAGGSAQKRQKQYN